MSSNKIDLGILVTILAIFIPSLIYFIVERKEYRTLIKSSQLTESQYDSLNRDLIRAKLISSNLNDNLLLVKDDIYYKNDTVEQLDSLIDVDFKQYNAEYDKGTLNKKELKSINRRIIKRTEITEQYAFEINMIDTHVLFRQLLLNRTKNSELKEDIISNRKTLYNKSSNCN